MNLGLSGRLTRATIKSPLTPLFLIAAVIAGLIALAVIPREEEPQISVPMVDIMVQADGLKAPDAAELVTKPLEEIVKGINGVEHVYSQTQDDRVMVTARFLTGTDRGRRHIAGARETARQLRPHSAGHSRAADHRPRHQRCRHRDPDACRPNPTRPRAGTRRISTSWRARLQAELAKVDNVGLTYIAGGTADADQRRARPGKAGAVPASPLQQLEAKIQGANRSFLAGHLRENGRMAARRWPAARCRGVPDIGAAAGHHARRPRRSMCATSPKVVRSVRRRTRALMSGRWPAARRGLEQRARPSPSPSPSAPAPMR